MFKGAVGVRPRPAPLRRGHGGAVWHGPGSRPRGSEASASRAEGQPVPARAGRGAGARGSPECPWPGRSRPGLRTPAERGGKPRPGSQARGCHGKLCSRRPEGRPRRRRGGLREQRLDGGRTVVAAAEEVVRFWKVCHRYLERSQEPGGPLPAGDGWGGRGGLLPSPDWPQGRSVVSVWPGRRTQAFWQTLF